MIDSYFQAAERKLMLRYHDVAQNTARLRALTTLEPHEFMALVPVFEACFLERMRDYTIDGLPRLNRRYTPSNNSPLPTIEDKLLFMLVHMKQNLTHDVQGQRFGMIQSDANKWVQLLRPVLLRALERLDMVPARLARCMAVPEQHSLTDHPPLFIMMGQNVPSNDQ
jgi:hypothetical protein